MTHPKVTLRREAQIALLEIREYTRVTWGARQAERYLRGLSQRLLQLATHPEMAPAADSVTSVRMALYRSHRILYRPTRGGIDVGHVLHQAVDFSIHLERFARLRDSEN